MKKALLYLIGFIVFAQAQFQSAYLNQPDLFIPYVDSCATFWTNVYDDNLGGFYTEVDKTGNILNTNKKNMITQSRNAYAMVRAFQLTGDTTYLNYARGALNFQIEHAWDETYGGWFDGLNSRGWLTNPTENKTAFNQHYAILGLLAYYEATNDTFFRNWVETTYQNNETYLWDNHETLFGYYDYANDQMRNPIDKSFNATVDAITTHLLQLYLITGDQQYLNRLNELGQNILDRLVASMPSQAIGFAEKYDSGWNIKSNETMTIMGHVLKTGWCLARLYYLTENQEYLDAAKYVVNDVLEKGYDHQYGGPYKDYNRVTGEMLMWGLQDTAKAWWQMEQAVTAGLMLYDLTGNQTYLNMADETLDFFMKYFVDHHYGEVYADRTRTGGLAWNENKGSGGKAGYHSTELGYYGYLYASLYLLDQPAHLFYYISPLDHDRTIVCNPIPYKQNQLYIGLVEKEQIAYDQFDPEKKEIFIPAGTGGIFKVTFQTTPPQKTDIAKQIPNLIQLHQNYPNPFNPSTTISFELKKSASVSLQIFNQQGQMVYSLINNDVKSEGTHSVIWDGKNANGQQVPSGVYYYRLTADNISIAKPMVYIK
ncbi:MAG: hypothetical protein Kow00108_00050 [Calditrichia bacterium]